MMGDRCACFDVDRTFPDFLAHTASLPHLERIGPTYIASVIAVFYAHAAVYMSSGRPSLRPGIEDIEIRYATAAVVPLTELLAARGLIDTVPVVDWLLAGGATQLGSTFPANVAHAT